MQKKQTALNQTQRREFGRKLLTRRTITQKMCRGYPCWEYEVSWRPSTKDVHRPTIRVKGKKTYVPRLAAVLWLGFDPKSGLQINHHCDNTRCFQPKHLYAGTPKNNVDDAVRRGRHVMGERMWKHKLTEDQVLEIRRLREETRLSREAIARKFGVGATQVTHITQGHTWKHLTKDI